MLAALWNDLRQRKPLNSAVSNFPGFTLVEFMIVVTGLTLLAAIVVPKFADLVRKADEAKTKGYLGAVRSALSIYYVDNEGQFPSDLGALTLNGKYLSGIPPAEMPPYHID